MMRTAGLLILALGLCPACSGAEAPLAWVRFGDASHEYAGKRYVWLGFGELRLHIEVAPAPGHVLELLWGAKNDTRDAVVVINGRSRVVRGGGYDGFRWLGVAMPGKLTGRRYEIVVQQRRRPEAFIAAVRLVDASRPATVPAEPSVHKVAVKALPTPPKSPARRASARAPAFQAMRSLWDTPAPPPETPCADPALEAAFRQAERNARDAAEAFYRARKFVGGWLACADPETGLIPRNLSRDRDIWNAKDAAADNYPFMVLTAAMTDRELFAGRMHQMLRTEQRLTNRLDRLPDTWSFSRRGFRHDKADLGRMVFGASEYAKDGLLPITEWLGRSPWLDRMVGLVDDLWKHAPAETPYGRIPSTNVEVNGEQLQVLSRLYWITGERKYLDWALRLGDYYLLGGNDPTRKARRVRLIAHGGEIFSGLAELYCAARFAAPDKRAAYRKPLHAMFDRILAIGRNAHGMIYTSVDPRAGKGGGRICDTWGYTYNGVYAVYLADGTEAYRQAARQALASLKDHYLDYHWGSADEYADTVEGAINLLNCEDIPSAGEWADATIRRMWTRQRPDGVIEGWHGDGNNARTSLLYALWKTRGLTARPWRPDLRFGAARRGKALCVSVRAERPWAGRLLFDRPRHKTDLHLPIDYPRLNRFPEWFTAASDKRYAVREGPAGRERTLTGRDLQRGVDIECEGKREVRLIVWPSGR